jgi:anti-sigma factor RsiW
MNGHVDDELPALLGGELPPSVAAAVHAHLAGCGRCRLPARISLADPAEVD